MAALTIKENPDGRNYARTLIATWDPVDGALSYEAGAAAADGSGVNGVVHTRAKNAADTAAAPTPDAASDSGEAAAAYGDKTYGEEKYGGGDGPTPPPGGMVMEAIFQTLRPSTEYTVTVTPTLADASATPGTVKLTTGPFKLDAPVPVQDDTAEQRGDLVSLKWDPVPAASGYRVVGTSPDDCYPRHGWLTSDETSYVTPVRPGSTYTFAVTALGGFNYTDSDPGTVDVTPSDPAPPAP